MPSRAPTTTDWTVNSVGFEPAGRYGWKGGSADGVLADIVVLRGRASGTDNEASIAADRPLGKGRIGPVCRASSDRQPSAPIALFPPQRFWHDASPLRPASHGGDR